MKKCEWKAGGPFVPCDELSHELRYSPRTFQKDENGVCIATDGSRYYIDHCFRCGASLKKPVEIKPGVFGYFCTEDYFYFEWGYLAHTDSKGFYPIRNTTLPQGQRMLYPKFIPGLPDDVNQDGSPKEGEV